MATRMTAAAVGIGVVVIAVGGAIYWMATSGGRGNPPAGGSSQPSTAPATATAPALNPAAVQKIFAAVDADDVALTKELLANEPVLIKARGPSDGETPLHGAKSVAMAELLLEHGAELMALDKTYHAPPVRWAAGEQRKEVVKFLVSKGAAQDDLFFAVAMGDAPRVAALLKKDPELLADLTERDALGSNVTALHIAARTGQAGSAKALIAAGANVSAKAGWGNAEPLESAAWTGATDVVAVLLDHGANVNAVIEQKGHTSLWYAAVTGRKDVVGLMLSRGATVEKGLVAAVVAAKTKPYPGMNLPPKEDYDAVVELLRKYEKTE